MAKIFYVEDEDGKYYSSDKTRRFKALQGKELYNYLNTPESHVKRFYIEDDIGIEIPAETRKIIRKYERRKQYVSDIEKEHNYTVISLNSGIPTNDDYTAEEVIPDIDVNIEDTAIDNVMLEKLRNALTYLTDDEYELITQLIYTDTPISQRELSLRTGLPQKTIDNRKTAILRKLKKIIEN